MSAHAFQSATTKQAIAHKNIFAAGLDHIEDIGGGCLCFVFYEMINGMRVELVERLVMPISALPDGIGKSLMALGRQVLVKPDGSITVIH